MNDLWWLVPPALIALMSIVLRRSLGLRFGWPLFCQAALILILAVVAYLSEAKVIWICLCWLLFVIFLLLPNQIILRCERFSSSLRPDDLLRAVRWIRFFYWGELSTFWTDIYKSYACFMTNDFELGNSILSRWESQKLPAYFAEQVKASRLVSHAFARDWQEIISIVQNRSAPSQASSPGLCIQAARAYAEIGDFTHADQCLRAANMVVHRVSLRNFCIISISLFALAGDGESTRKIIGFLSSDRYVSSMFLRSWWARCLVAQGRFSEAKLLLSELQKEAEALVAEKNRKAWCARILQFQKYLECARTESDAARDQVNETRITNVAIAQGAWGNFKVGATTLQLSSPLYTLPVVWVLTWTLVLCFIASGGGDILANQSILQFCLQHCRLDANQYKIALDWAEFLYTKLTVSKEIFQNGEYYRLITYQFLHGSIGHCLLNVAGLVWFGRVSASIYGSARFLFIYFMSGVFGGLMHALLSDVPAIGASAAIFGIFASVAFAYLKLSGQLVKESRVRELRAFTAMAVGQIFLDRIIPKVAGWAHIGGMISGFLLAAIVFPRGSNDWCDRAMAVNQDRCDAILKPY